jgi:hypothetical protein
MLIVNKQRKKHISSSESQHRFRPSPPSFNSTLRSGANHPASTKPDADSSQYNNHQPTGGRKSALHHQLQSKGQKQRTQINTGGDEVQRKQKLETVGIRRSMTRREAWCILPIGIVFFAITVLAVINEPYLLGQEVVFVLGIFFLLGTALTIGSIYSLWQTRT